jgi:hypothetical protein
VLLPRRRQRWKTRASRWSHLRCALSGHLGDGDHGAHTRLWEDQTDTRTILSSKDAELAAAISTIEVGFLA